MKLTKFNFDENTSLRSTMIEGEPWFLGIDATRALGYTNNALTIRRYCKEHGISKRYTSLGTASKTMLYINMPNLLRLMSNSNMPLGEKFERWVFEEVLIEIQKTGSYKGRASKEPKFLTRFRANLHAIPNDHFSVITEMYVRLYSELEKHGYVIPDKSELGKTMMPDISVGSGFAKFLKSKNSDFYNKHKKYEHTFPDGRPSVKANMYPVDALPLFIKYIHEVWIPTKAVDYFKKRDMVALQYLPKLLKSA